MMDAYEKLDAQIAKVLEEGLPDEQLRPVYLRVREEWVRLIPSSGPFLEAVDATLVARGQHAMALQGFRHSLARIRASQERIAALKETQAAVEKQVDGLLAATKRKLGL